MCASFLVVLRPAVAAGFLFALAQSGCAGGPAATDPSHFATVTLTITDAGVEPAPDTDLPQFGTIVFRNGRTGGDLEVEVERPFAPSEPCSTALNFTGSGITSRSRRLAPQAIASLCFHETGTFAYVVRGSDSDGPPLKGVIRVGGRQ